MRLKLNQKRATILLCSVAVAAFATSAFARPVHHYRHHAAAVAQTAVEPQKDVADRDVRYPVHMDQADAGTTARGHHGRRSPADARAQAQSPANSADGGFTSNNLVAEARKYIGTNPTGRGSLWCGAFMDLVLKRTGHAGGGNLAWGYQHYGAARVRPAGRRHRGDGPPRRRPCRRGLGHRRQRQSDHRVGQSQPHGRGIGLSARTHCGLRAARRLIDPTTRQYAERPAYAAGRFFYVSRRWRSRRRRSPRHRRRNRRGRNSPSACAESADRGCRCPGSTSVAAQRTMRLTTLSRALPIASSRPSRSNSCQAGQPAT